MNGGTAHRAELSDVPKPTVNWLLISTKRVLQLLSGSLSLNFTEEIYN